MSESTIPSANEMINFFDPAQFKEDLKFDLSDLNGAMSTHAGLYAHYASAAVRARSQADTFKTTFEVWENLLDNLHRTRLKEENPKTTEPMIRAAVVTDPRWRKASKNLNDAMTQQRLCESAEHSFSHRKDMMLQIARNMAKEQEGPLRVTANLDARTRVMEALARNAKVAETAAETAA
jgi:hypothetical protein